jgi:hypothetical protein
MKPTETTLPPHLADALLDLEVMLDEHACPVLPPSVAFDLSSTRFHLAALQGCLERLAARVES